MIRPARRDDAPAIQALVAAAYAPYIPRIGREPGPMLDDYPARIADGHAHVLEHEGRIEGLVVLIPQARAMLLDNVAVHPRAQGMGFGRDLIRFAEAATRAAGHATLRLYTHQAMVENIALYARLGFVETHRAEDQGYSRVFMARTLQSG